MELKQLRAFMVVAEELNFRRSAERLAMSQPPLTRLIASLEEELAAPLFERTTRQVKLTSAGMFLLQEGREILAQVESTEKEIRALGKIRSGQIKIGFSTTAFLARLPKIIEEFRLQFPKLKTELYQGTRRKILSGVRDGSLDIGFAEGVVSEKELTSQLVKDEALGALLPKKHPFAKRKQIELATLRDEIIILHPRKEHQDYFDTIQQLFRRNGISPTVYIKAEGESCPLLVSLGKGVVITVAGTRNKVPQETSFVPIANLLLPVSATWIPGNENPLLKSFLSYISENAVLGRQKVECLADVMLHYPEAHAHMR